jgi:hypothetical protein
VLSFKLCWFVDLRDLYVSRLLRERLREIEEVCLEIGVSYLVFKILPEV